MRKNNQSGPCTRLKAIGGHPVVTLKIDDLRMFCVRNQIKRARKVSKVQLCRAIADAKVKFDAGYSPPFQNLFNDHEVEQKQSPVDVTIVDDSNERTNRKRSLEDLEEADIERHNSMHLSITDHEHQENLVAIQSRIARSIEAKNMAVHLKETIDSASAIRCEIREERAHRDVLWTKLVKQVGDEGEALSKYTAFRKAKQDNQSEIRLDDDDCVKQTIECLLDDIFDVDGLIKQLKKHHAKLSEAVSKLV